MDVTRNQLQVRGAAGVGPDVRAQVESRLQPLHAEVEAERDGVVLVVDGENVGYFKTLKSAI